MAFKVDAADADAIGDEPIWHDGKVVGWVTSGAYGHRVGASLALGYVPAALARGRGIRDRDHRRAAPRRRAGGGALRPERRRRALMRS
jgi:glycine cleavage system aminomethyltransferase T